MNLQQSELPTRDEFIGFRRSLDRVCVRPGCSFDAYLPLAVLLGVIAISMDPKSSLTIPFGIGSIVIVVLFSVIVPFCRWLKCRRFLRCGNCGFLIHGNGRHPRVIGGCGVEPDWSKVARTGLCPVCDSRKLIDTDSSMRKCRLPQDRGGMRDEIVSCI